MSERRSKRAGGGSGRAVAWASVLVLGVALAAGGCATGKGAGKGTGASAEEQGSEEKLPDPSEQTVPEQKESAAASEKGAKDESDGDQGGGGSKPLVGSTRKKIERAVDISEKGNDQRAKRILGRFVDDSKVGFLASYNLGVIAEKEGDVSGAATHYTKALQKNPDFTPALLNLVRLYIRKGRVGDADQIATKFVNQRPDNLNHRVAKLEVMLANDEHRNVIRKAKEILRRDERNVEAMIAMAKANYRLERYELTKAILERASELASERAEIYFLFGLVAWENDRRGRAISNMEKSLKLNPRFAEAHNNLGLLYHEAGDFEAAAEQFRAAIDDYPEFKEAKLNLGIALKQLGTFEKAEAKFKEVIEMDSEYADAYFNLGVLYLDSKLPNLGKIERLRKSIDYLNDYKRVVRGQLDQDDPADDYIKSAREKIKAEKQRRKMMRQAQQPAKGNKGGSGKSGQKSNDASKGGSNDGSKK